MEVAAGLGTPVEAVGAAADLVEVAVVVEPETLVPLADQAASAVRPLVRIPAAWVGLVDLAAVPDPVGSVVPVASAKTVRMGVPTDKVSNFLDGTPTTTISSGGTRKALKGHRETSSKTTMEIVARGTVAAIRITSINSNSSNNSTKAEWPPSSSCLKFDRDKKSGLRIQDLK